MQWKIIKTTPSSVLDKRDVLLLDLILMDSRTPLKKIATKLHISKPAALKRIQKLEKRGVIQGYSCFINFNALGLKTYQIGIKVNMTIEQKEQYSKQLEDLGFVNQILSLTGGRWDFLCRVVCPEELFIQILDSIVEKNIERMDILQMYGGVFAKQEKIIPINSKNISSSREEIYILHALAENSKERITTLAEKSNLSVPTVRKTLKKLENNNILLAPVTKINPFVYGTQGFLLVITTKTRQIEKKIGRALANVKSTGVLFNFQYPNIISFHMIETMSDMKKVESVLIPFLDNIASYEFIEITEQRKYEFFPDAIQKLLFENAK